MEELKIAMIVISIITFSCFIILFILIRTHMKELFFLTNENRKLIEKTVILEDRANVLEEEMMFLEKEFECWKFRPDINKLNEKL